MSEQDKQDRKNGKKLRQQLRDAGLSVYPTPDGKYKMADQLFESYKEAFLAALARL